MDYAEWKKLGEDNGWRISRKPIWLLRAPIVRHLRFAWHNWRLQMHVNYYARNGEGFFAQERDVWYLHAIYYGEA